MTDLSRLGLNGATVQRLGALATIDACARHGIGHVGLWREKAAAAGAPAIRRRLRETGVSVSSLCRGGFFPAPTAAARRERLADNLRAVDEAAELETDLLVLVCGGVVDHDLAGSRAMVEGAIAELAPYAAERGVRLGIEPLHPMFAADRSVVVSLAQALALAERIGSPAVGVVVDAYHVWWEEDVEARIESAGARLLGFHVDDWIVPLPDPLLGRGMMGDGVIDLRGLRRSADRAGYRGPIEVEIFNQAIWDAPADETIATVCERYVTHVLG